MIGYEVVSAFLYENCEGVEAHKNGFVCRCPLCGDSKKNKRKKRFYVTLKDGRFIYHCFNCDASGNFVSLYADILGISKQEAYKRLVSIDNVRTILSSKKPKDDQVVFQRTFSELLKYCITEDSDIDSGYINKIGKTYISEFRVKRKIPDCVPLYFCYYGTYKNRIIIPIIENDKIVYFQARSINAEPKYLNPPMPKRVIIPNIDRLVNDKPIIVTEGLIDSFMVPNGTALLGSMISDEFLNKLKEINSDIIVALDNDVTGNETLNKLLHSKWNKMLRYLIWPKEMKVKDLNQLAMETEVNVYEFVLKNSHDYWDIIKYKLEECYV